MRSAEGRSRDVRYAVIIIAVIVLVAVAVIILASPGFWWLVHNTA
jgi:FlaG/FlaF family flagellin (archaellin)